MKVPGNIEEMARVLDACPFIGASIGCDKHDGSIKIAEYLYYEGYSKQKESVWSTSVNFNVPTQKITGYGHICQLCFYMYNDKNPYGHKFCPNCGSKMKGGAE